MPALENQQQEIFCQHYARSGNATKAAEAAEYSPKTARQQGSRLLTYVDIQQRIAEIRPEIRLELSERLNADVAYVIAGFVTIAEESLKLVKVGDSGNFLDQLSLFGVEIEPEYELKDPTSALKAFRSIGETHAMFINNIEVTDSEKIAQTIVERRLRAREAHAAATSKE